MKTPLVILAAVAAFTFQACSKAQADTVVPGKASGKLEAGYDTWRDANNLMALGMDPEVVLARLCQKPEIARAMTDAGQKCPTAQASAGVSWNQSDPYLRARNDLPPLTQEQ